MVIPAADPVLPNIASAQKQETSCLTVDTALFTSKRERLRAEGKFVGKRHPWSAEKDVPIANHWMGISFAGNGRFLKRVYMRIDLGAVGCGARRKLPSGGWAGVIDERRNLVGYIAAIYCPDQRAPGVKIAKGINYPA